ncbi:uncharacterized protein MONBRDRAFT_6204 [Monosiga brevicollis MX1]|uniref:Uncharacterized protein n=1 Tax=Monosiga brevicollis TaxID=81824 RepID=A9UT51_MONBE|nr:uncharacterized protein MONBRDRAFT_6204 [Monosiga brevicollis MX1]EDQ91184.1 predicted protein [Monosiga brevicollis MX1]|eukprot:XP_001743606.1 hypothetical protein [Monosiga brevicollis MX1]
MEGKTHQLALNQGTLIQEGKDARANFRCMTMRGSMGERNEAVRTGEACDASVATSANTGQHTRQVLNKVMTEHGVDVSKNGLKLVFLALAKCILEESNSFPAYAGHTITSITIVR